ncbi:hypothetical protein PR048_020277 [Dryococelus australis]|uniref:HAT C-terminal dimerisation domain-containing protein n=1 Tax=Dryococelus australis TaxID=614101 RepID=A0ABQ9H5W1_9NEOP|nr:hypothetical protein PR048_020277 [Dryococelus australis]
MYSTLANFTKYVQCVIELREESEERFSDFDSMKTMLKLFTNFMSAKTEDQDPKFQMKLYNWQVPQASQLYFKVTAMFGSTCICECTFSTMKILELKQRNSLSQEL